MDQRFSEILEKIYSAVAELEAMFPGRPFTPDGHMVGSIGEAIAAYHYGVKLYSPSNPKFDAQKGGKQVQIKATQKESVELRHGDGALLVFRINHDGGFEEVYNGNASRVWQFLAHRKATNTGHISISLKQLRLLQEDAEQRECVARER